ncbi:MAG: MmpS family transport accessory protein, partial [Mycobacterium sp.]
MRNAWLPLLIVAVVAIGGFAVARVKSFYGADNADTLTSAKVDDSKPFKPK